MKAVVQKVRGNIITLVMYADQRDVVSIAHASPEWLSDLMNISMNKSPRPQHGARN
jgi:hypothetical protein